MTHVIGVAAMALVIDMAPVRRVVIGPVVPLPLVAGVSGMATMAVVRAVVAMTLIVGCFGRRAVMMRAVAVPLTRALVIAVRMGAGLVRHVGSAPGHRPVDQVPVGHIERAGDPPALPCHDAQGGLRHRPLDAVKPLPVLRRRNAADDQQIRGGWSIHDGPPPPAYLRLGLQPEFRRTGHRHRQHRGAGHRRTP
ncbi:hypothetical protein ABZ499_16195 [Streptomyces sp. NPDC019990]|uniref:hypothetical protein n=1 Tax=Streptomyces sp. NPDC019990 TaxID=3154693 RepID=UPI0033E4696B